MAIWGQECYRDMRYLHSGEEGGLTGQASDGL
jgi:hypothetical protein